MVKVFVDKVDGDIVLHIIWKKMTRTGNIH